MSTTEASEQTPLVDRCIWALRVGIAGTFLGVGAGSIILATQELDEAHQSSTCIDQASTECEQLVSEERKDLAGAWAGGLMLSGLGLVALTISRKEEQGE